MSLIYLLMIFSILEKIPILCITNFFYTKCLRRAVGPNLMTHLTLMIFSILEKIPILCSVLSVYFPYLWLKVFWWTCNFLLEIFLCKLVTFLLEIFLCELVTFLLEIFLCKRVKYSPLTLLVLSIYACILIRFVLDTGFSANFTLNRIKMALILRTVTARERVNWTARSRRPCSQWTLKPLIILHVAPPFHSCIQ